MAETLTIQRSNIGTHNMHVYPGETPTGVWASIEAQNAGVVAGNWQNHLECTPSTDVLEAGVALVWTEVQVEQWRMRWPKLGSYTRLSFWAAADTWPAIADYNMDFYVRLWNAGYTATFYAATVTQEFEYSVGLKHRITFDWDMSGANMSSHIDTNIFIELVAKKTVSNHPGSETWVYNFNEFLIVTANRPL